MSNFAMVVNGRVIEVLHDRDTTPVWPPDKNGNIVRAICCDDSVERGMRYNEITKTFFYADQSEPLTETEERQIDILLNTEYIACLLESQLA